MDRPTLNENMRTRDQIAETAIQQWLPMYIAIDLWDQHVVQWKKANALQVERNALFHENEKLEKELVKREHFCDQARGERGMYEKGYREAKADLTALRKRVGELEGACSGLFKLFHNDSFWGDEWSVDILPILQKYGFAEEEMYDSKKHGGWDLGGEFDEGDPFWHFTDKFRALLPPEER